MEPRSIERGNAGNRQVKGNIMWTLQWSHARLSVETIYKFIGHYFLRSLQWSHARLSVETCERDFIIRDGKPASMEPRSIERGNSSCGYCGSTAIVRLQWSHARLSVETYDETEGELTIYVASMEPRSIERGNPAYSPRLWRLGSASMEPRSIERGNLIMMGLPNYQQLRFNGATLD